MEGLGYWIFLAGLYLLSALMKKRQRQAARRQLDQEESGTLQKEKPKSFQAEFLQGVFGDMKEMVVEPQEKIEDEFSDFEVVEIEEEPEPVHVPVEHDHVVFEDLSKRDLIPIHKEYQYWKKGFVENPAIEFSFRGINDLKRAIVLKEILDKPRAMRREIR